MHQAINDKALTRELEEKVQLQQRVSSLKSKLTAHVTQRSTTNPFRPAKPHRIKSNQNDTRCLLQSSKSCFLLLLSLVGPRHLFLMCIAFSGLCLDEVCPRAFVFWLPAPQQRQHASHPGELGRLGPEAALRESLKPLASSTRAFRCWR